MTPLTWQLDLVPRKATCWLTLARTRTQGADRPLQVGIPSDNRFLMGKMPDLLAPVLKVDVSQIGSVADEDLDGTTMQARFTFGIG